MTVATTQFGRNPISQGSGIAQTEAADTNRFQSPAIWDDCPWVSLDNGELDGAIFFDDFNDFPLPGTQTTEIWLGRYKVYNTGAGKVIFDSMPHTTTPGQAGGIVSMLCDTNEDQSVIGTQSCPFLLTTTQTGKLWFEARVATTSILANMGQWFVGLSENSVVTFGAATPLADANAQAGTAAMIGFNRLESGLGVWNTSYSDHAAAWTDIGTAANSTLAANTWTKLGMKVDFANSARCVRFFVDNVECSTAMTKAALLALTHVDVKSLGPCMAFFADTAGTACYTYLDWWKIAQTF